MIGVEWEAADVGQGPMQLFGQTIQIQPIPKPHYMLHIYFEPAGKVLFGTNAQTMFNPNISCPKMPETGGIVSPSQLGGILLALMLGGLVVLGLTFFARQRLS